jgi:uncharacterized protein (TIRG00374 family)
MNKRLTAIPKWLILFFKILVSVLALGYVVWKLRHEEDNLLRAFTGLESGDYLRIAICFLLIFANQGIEAFKWMWMMRRYYPELKYTTAVQAILAGNTAGIVTPARIGEYAGRVMFLPEGSRIEALSLTLMDRISQLLVTIWVGVLSGVYLLYAFRSKLLAVFPLTENYFFLFLYLIVGGLMLVTFLLLNPQLLYKIIHPFVHKIPVLHTFVSAFQQVDSRTLLTIFSLSFCRASVFCSQYYLLLSAFGYETDFLLKITLVALVLLVKSIIPSIAFAELGIRESVAVTIMSAFSVPIVIVVSATLLLYVFNIALPALVGIVFLQRMGNKE